MGLEDKIRRGLGYGTMRSLVQGGHQRTGMEEGHSTLSLQAVAGLEGEEEVDDDDDDDEEEEEEEEDDDNDDHDDDDDYDDDG